MGLEYEGKLRVVGLTRRESGRDIKQDRVVVNDAVVDSARPTDAMFNVEPPTLVPVLEGRRGHPAGDTAPALAVEVVVSGRAEVKTEQDVKYSLIRVPA